MVHLKQSRIRTVRIPENWLVRQLLASKLALPFLAFAGSTSLKTESGLSQGVCFLSQPQRINARPLQCECSRHRHQDVFPQGATLALWMRTEQGKQPAVEFPSREANLKLGHRFLTAPPLLLHGKIQKDPCPSKAHT